MSTAVRLRLGPKHEGYPLSLEEFLGADYQKGFKYELIGGKLVVSPEAGLPHNRLEIFLLYLLWRYAERYPHIINYVTKGARVFIPDAVRITCPEPDLAAYHNFPPHREGESWEDVSPLLVAEILSPDNAVKDLVRNAELYLQVPSIKEYWVVDGITDPDRPTLKAHRRWGQKWRIIDVPYGGTYTTRLLPGFELVMNPFGA